MMNGAPDVFQLQETLYVSKNPTRRWLHCSRRDWIIDKLRDLSREHHGKALEAGFGSGVHLPTLSEVFGEVVAIDIDESLVQHARSMIKGSYPNVSVVQGDLTCSALPDDTFDLILCSQVLKQVPEPRLAIREMYRMLRPGGILLLTSQQPLSPVELAGRVILRPPLINFVRLIYKEAVRQPSHRVPMRAKVLVSELHEAGFTIRDRFSSGAYIPLVAELFGKAALRLEQWMEPRMRGGPLEELLWEQYYIAEKAAPLPDRKGGSSR
ncbi:MAG TPA: class I SAM-dependent methyltransferase [Candidatus Binataceae bacterium]|nr:class I SAM-dependent methyltransferase [Candidatus Binataceae bacterium]